MNNSEYIGRLQHPSHEATRSARLVVDDEVTVENSNASACETRAQLAPPCVE